MKILVIGAGLFGSTVAYTLSDGKSSVDLVDSESDIMQLASKVNHNRIHLGYHYLRSIETAEQSIEGLLSFLFNYGSAVIHQFPNYYAIAKSGSKTSPEKFIDFCETVGIGYEEDYPDKEYLNREAVEASFRVPEPIWDYALVKRMVKDKLLKTKVNLYLKTECIGLKVLADNTFEARLTSGVKRYDVVINCSYSGINRVNSFLGIRKKRLLFEDVIVPIFKYPSAPFGVTVMDGPFCSIMPKGKDKNSFLLYHVKESVLESCLADEKPNFATAYRDEDLMGDNGIYKESSFFMPFLMNVVTAGFGRTTRTVYENSDDARITELYIDSNIKNYFTVLSGKVTTCVQLALEIKHILQGKNRTKRFKI